MSDRQHMTWALSELDCPICGNEHHKRKVWPRYISPNNAQCIGCDRALTDVEIHFARSMMPDIVKNHRKAMGADESGIWLAMGVSVAFLAVICIAVGLSVP